MPINEGMRCALLLMLLIAGCGWKPRPYVRDPMGRVPVEPAGAAGAAAVKPAWPTAPEPPAEK